MTGFTGETVSRPTQARTLRIDRPVIETEEQQVSGDIPVPYIFIRHPAKTIVRASALAEYGPGTHYVTTAWGKTARLPELHFLHYPIRGFDKFQTKVANTRRFFEKNQHLEPWWGWHWRRWNRLSQEGGLREEYENQLLSVERAERLIRAGICSRDQTIADWVAVGSATAGAARVGSSPVCANDTGTASISARSH
jgi:hypothetical protein